MFLSSHKRDILTRFLDKGSEEELYLDIWVLNRLNKKITAQKQNRIGSHKTF
jgi:hypothetical protein